MNLSIMFSLSNSVCIILNFIFLLKKLVMLEKKSVSAYFHCMAQENLDKELL